MNIRQLMKQAQQMQEKMQQELDDLIVEASVGGDIVAIKMNGHKQLLSVKIEPEAIDPDDPSMLEDLVISAVNCAVAKVDEALHKRMGGLTGLF